MDIERLKQLGCRVEDELRENILKFWMDNTVDRIHSGFHGYVSRELAVDEQHDRASVLYFRILWTFSKAYGLYGESSYLEMADRAYNYISEHYWDMEYSGVYWMLNCDGEPVNTKKQVYSIAFAIYGLSEYYLATGNMDSLDKAVELYAALEKYAYDRINKGYFEALTRDWSPLSDMTLSEKDLNSAKSMNTHLHVLEAYTNLFRAWPNNILRLSLKELLRVVIDHIIDLSSGSFKLFFDEMWNPLTKTASYGHDIEGSWLLYEAVDVLGDEGLLAEVRSLSVMMAQSVLTSGFDREYGGIFYESDGKNHRNMRKDWWPQAEGVVGFLNAYELTGKESFMEAALETWRFIDSHLIDRENGEWFWAVSRNGRTVLEGEKAGPWKCPYHNSRMCYEVMSRINNILKKEITK